LRSTSAARALLVKPNAAASALLAIIRTVSRERGKSFLGCIVVTFVTP
jgi:hypothetical protein